MRRESDGVQCGNIAAAKIARYSAIVLNVVAKLAIDSVSFRHIDAIPCCFTTGINESTDENHLPSFSCSSQIQIFLA